MTAGHGSHGISGASNGSSRHGWHDAGAACTCHLLYARCAICLQDIHKDVHPSDPAPDMGGGGVLTQDNTCKCKPINMPLPQVPPSILATQHAIFETDFDFRVGFRKFNSVEQGLEIARGAYLASVLEHELDN